MNTSKTIPDINGLSHNKVFTDSDKLPSLEGICEADHLLTDSVKNTPLFRSESLSELFEADVWIKDETVSPIASFKARGALTDLIRCNLVKKVRGVVTSSTGNHGQGVAFAARQFNIPAHIFLPKNPNPHKRRGVQNLGADIHEHGFDLDDAKVKAREFALSNDFLFIDDGESLNVIEGAGTVGLEIAQTLKNIDAVFIPMGSGSLASGSAAAIKLLQPNAKVIAVQSEGSPAMVKSFHARRAISHSINTVADGLVCREPAVLALKSLLAFVDDAILVSDEELLEGVSSLAGLGGVSVEASGAASFAGAYKLREEIIGKKFVLVLSGANINREREN